MRHVIAALAARVIAALILIAIAARPLAGPPFESLNT
jgi:hypothetical protein